MSSQPLAARVPADAHTSDIQPAHVVSQSVFMRRFIVLLFAWFAATVALNLTFPGEPGDAAFVLMVVAATLVPPMTFLLAYRRSAPFRDAVLRLDFGAITAIQTARIAGGAFLVLWSVDQMAPAFALWAGGLDVLIGLTAVLMAFVVATRRPFPRRALRAWHTLGLLDFAVAFPLGVMLTSSSLGVLPGEMRTDEVFSLPLAFIPMVGVAFTMTMHVLALLQLRDGRSPRCAPLLHEPAEA